MSQWLPYLLGGLGLFLYAISKLSNRLKTLFSDRAIEMIGKYTSNIFLSILIGMVLTIVLGSSSAVIIIVIVFINSEALTFRQSMGIILGANLGTTFSSKIIAIGIGQYSVIPLLMGLAFMLFVKNQYIKHVASAVMYFGMLFFGLFIIEQSVLPLSDTEMFNQWIANIDSDSLHGALTGGLITLIIQSSSGTVGMAIILGKQNLLTLSGGLALMLGAELGTCSDTLIAAIRGSRQAIKAALFHLFYSLITISLALLLFGPLVLMIEGLFPSQDIGTQIANGHVLFNMIGVLLCIPFVAFFEKSFNWMLPDKVQPIKTNNDSIRM